MIWQKLNMQLIDTDLGAYPRLGSVVHITLPAVCRTLGTIALDGLVLSDLDST